MADTFLLIDGHYHIYRSFFAFGTRPLTNSEGERVETAYTIATLLWTLYRERREDWWAMALESRTPTFRHQEYAEYKAHREAMPPELRQQLPWVEEIIAGFRIPTLQVEGYEADDLIASAATWAATLGMNVRIFSKDKDLEQLLSARIKMRRELRQAEYGPEELFDKRGIRPDQVVDYQALIGDATDNIPGVPGIGPKTAVKILAALEAAGIPGALERLLEDPAPDGIAAGTLRKIRDHAEGLGLSRRLVELERHVPLPPRRDGYAVVEPDHERLQTIFLKLGFQKLLKEMSAEAPGAVADLRGEDTLFASPAAEPPRPRTTPPGKYGVVSRPDDLGPVVEAARRSGRLALQLVATDRDPLDATLLGIGVATEPGRGIFVPVPDRGGAPGGWEILVSLLEDADVRLVGHDLKYACQVLRGAGVTARGLAHDTMVAAYLLNPTSGGTGLDSLLAERFAYARPQSSPEGGDGEAEGRSAAADADFILRLAGELEAEIDTRELRRVNDELEVPLIPVLADMEREGITLDPHHLEELEKEIGSSCARLEGEIHHLAGEPFNIASPKQLQDVLFGKLGLAPIRKTKTGFSTSAEVLEELAVRNPDQVLPAMILEYRSLTKLLGTYILALPKLVKSSTGRLHTDLRQTVAATGRLSSNRPNLQNIPVKTELGRRVRRAFVPNHPDRVFLSADYSQIELRVLAHVSGDTGLKQALVEGADIHREVAARIGGKSPDEVTRTERNAAKAVNFGVIYGMGAFGLARDLGISRSEAKDFIDAFFRNFPGVRRFIDETIQDARERGEVRTLYGRRRPLPELSSRLQRDRKQGERFAVNTVIQGSAADLIKKAMVDVHRDLTQRRSAARMLLQIHDELLFEVPRADEAEESALLSEQMEGVLKLDVPLVVNVSSGEDWYEASK